MPPLVEVDRVALWRAVSRSVGSQTIELTHWRHDSIHAAFNQATGGLYRVAGNGCDRGEDVPWSLILKVVQPSDDPFGGTVDPAHASYWKREPLIYRSRVLEELPGIRAPRCFGVDGLEGGAAWIWLEDVPDHFGSRWPPARYQLAARRLGEFNGAYLAGRPLPAAGFLSGHWLRSFVDDYAGAFARLPGLLHHPMVRRSRPDRLCDRVLNLWDEREMLLGALERLPQTFCHLDAFPRNLLIDPDTQEVVALDWSFAGIGPIGTELAPMVAASVCFYDAEPEQMRSIDEVVFDAYVEGLRAAGWRGRSQLVRLGYTAAASLRFGLFPMGVFMVQEEMRGRFEGLFAHSATDIVDRWARTAGFLLDQADEARQLVHILPYGSAEKADPGPAE
jgi:hypothetical protein